MAIQSDSARRNSSERAPAGALVPLYGSTDIVPGVQAVRRGNMVLYSVRGAPEVVRELMSHLRHEGVGEVVAFITHAASDGQSGEEEPATD